jgi:ABC-type dipeptide/oligopeptide/nickel transport system permease component
VKVDPEIKLEAFLHLSAEIVQNSIFSKVLTVISYFLFHNPIFFYFIIIHQIVLAVKGMRVAHTDIQVWYSTSSCKSTANKRKNNQETMSGISVPAENLSYEW